MLDGDTNGKLIHIYISFGGPSRFTLSQSLGIGRSNGITILWRSFRHRIAYLQDGQAARRFWCLKLPRKAGVTSGMGMARSCTRIDSRVWRLRQRMGGRTSHQEKLGQSSVLAMA